MPCDLHNMSVIKFLALVLGFRFTSHYSSLLSWLNKFYIYSTTAFFRLCSIKPCLGRQQVVIGCWIDLFLSIFIFFFCFVFVFYDCYFDRHWLNVSFIFQYSFTLFLTLFLQYLYCIIFLLGLLFCFLYFFCFFLCVFFVFFCVFLCFFLWFFFASLIKLWFSLFGLVIVVVSSRRIPLLHLVVFQLLLVRLVFKKRKKTIFVLST